MAISIFMFGTVTVCCTVILSDFSCLSVRLSVTDVGVAVTNLRAVCKIITCLENYGIFLEIVKSVAKLLPQVWTLCVAGYFNDVTRVLKNIHAPRAPALYNGIVPLGSLYMYRRDIASDV